MSVPMHVMRSSSLPDVKDLDESCVQNAIRMSRNSYATNLEANQQSQEYVIFDGRPVPVKRSSTASTQSNLTRSNDSLDNFDMDVAPFGNVSPKNDADLGTSRNRSEISRQARKILELEALGGTMGEAPAGRSPIDKNGTTTSPRPMSGRNQRLAALSAQVSELDAIVNMPHSQPPAPQYNFITPTNASLAGKQEASATVKRRFFPSPDKDSSAVATVTPDAVVEAEFDAFSSTKDSFSSTGDGKTAKRRGPPTSLAQRLALGSTERRKLSAASSAQSKSGAKGSVEGTPGDAASAAESGGTLGSSSFLARKLHSARSHPYPTTLSPTSGGPDGYSPYPDAQFPPFTPVAHTVPVTFFWKDKQAAQNKAGQQDIYLFIAHDNPQLGKTVSTQLNQAEFSSAGGASSKTSSSGRYSGGASGGNSAASGMLCMLECKDKATPVVNTHFLLGRIVYSGEYAGIEGAEAQQPRGSGCIVVTDLRAVRGDIKQLATKTRNDIIEVDLINVPAGFAVPLKTEEDLRTLLRPCVAHVDVILDPYHTSLQWFPYWEGARRMAPQFRSKGIGYLRLGDDMSQYGKAFMSLDAGNTYLDDGATSIVSKEGAGGVAGTPGSFASNLRLSRTYSGSAGGSGGGVSSGPLMSATLSAAPSSSSRARLGQALNDEKSPSGSDTASSTVPSSSTASPRSPRALSRIPVPADTEGTSAKRSPRPALVSQPLASSSAKSSALRKAGSSGNVKAAGPAREDPQWENNLTALRECIHLIKNGEGIKWGDRVEVMQKLAWALGNTCQFPTLEAFVAAYSNVLSEVVTLISDSFSKQNNPHVLVATAACVRSIEYGGVLAAQCGLAWRGLLVETVYALRSANKMVHEAVLDTLMHLYRCRSITLPMLCAGSLLEDLVVGARSGNSGNSKKGITKGASATSLKDVAAAGGNAGSTTGSGGAATTSKIATGANTARVVNWLQSIVTLEFEAIVAQYEASSGAGGAPNAGKLDVSALLKNAVVLLTHREEGTRDAALSLIGSVLAADVLQGQISLSALLALSKKLSGDALRKASATVKENADSEARMKTIEGALSAGAASFLGEVKQTSARFYEKALQLLAQDVSRVALNAAVSNAAKVAETVAGSASAPVLSARTVSNEGTVNSSGSTSPRPVVYKAGAPLSARVSSAGSVSNRKDLPVKSALVRADSEVTLGSNASTPPYSYAPAHHAVTAGQLSPTHTPRDSDAAPGPLSPSGKASSPTMDLDPGKMQQGLQGIKSMRARSAAGTTRANTTTVEIPADSQGVPVPSSASRAGSACRNRRRILTGPGDILPPNNAAVSPADTQLATADLPYSTSTADVLSPRRTPRTTLVSPRGVSTAGAVLAYPTERREPGLVNQSVDAPRVNDRAVAERINQELGGMWYEAKLLLRQVPRSEQEWSAVNKVISTAPAFFADLAALSSACKFPKGAILRHVLPFDENTSSNDQAKGRVASSQARDLGTPAALLGHEAALQGLGERAVDLRRVIRVKMADEADVNQAATAVGMLKSFLGRVNNTCTSTGLTVTQVVSALEL